MHAMGLLGIWALLMRFQRARCLCCVGCAMGHPCPRPPPANRLSYMLMEMPPCYQGENRRHLRTHTGSLTVVAFPDYKLQNVPHLCLPMSPGHLAGGLLDQPLSCSFSAPLLGLLKFSLCQVEINGDCHGNAFSVTTVCIWPSHTGTRNDSSYKIPFGLSRSSTFSAERSQPFIACTGSWVQAQAGHTGNGSSLPHVPGARPEGVEGSAGVLGRLARSQATRLVLALGWEDLSLEQQLLVACQHGRSASSCRGAGFPGETQERPTSRAMF